MKWFLSLLMSQLPIMLCLGSQSAVSEGFVAIKGEECVQMFKKTDYITYKSVYSGGLVTSFEFTKDTLCIHKALVNDFCNSTHMKKRNMCWLSWKMSMAHRV